MKNASVPNGHLHTDARGQPLARDVHDAAVLEIAAVADAHEIHIASQHAAEPDAGLGPPSTSPISQAEGARKASGATRGL